MKDTRIVLFVVILSLIASTLIAGQFKAIDIDKNAIYAVRMTEGNHGWNARDVIKLCPLSKAITGKHGESIKFAAVAVSKGCPQQ